jgi:hypothetical protein
MIWNIMYNLIQIILTTDNLTYLIQKFISGTYNLQLTHVALGKEICRCAVVYSVRIPWCIISVCMCKHMYVSAHMYVRNLHLLSIKRGEIIDLLKEKCNYCMAPNKLLEFLLGNGWYGSSIKCQEHLHTWQICFHLRRMLWFSALILIV